MFAKKAVFSVRDLECTVDEGASRSVMNLISPLLI